MPFDHRPIRPVDFPIVKLLLQILLRLPVLREHHDAGGLSVESVHDEAPRLRIGESKVINAPTVEGVNLQPIGGNGEKSVSYTHLTLPTKRIV